MSDTTIEGKCPIPLILSPSLEIYRGNYEEIIANAIEKIITFASNYNWDFYTINRLIKQIEIFSTKEKFDESVIKAFKLDSNTIVPKTASAIVANDILLIVSPEVYIDIYSQGLEENFYQKLITHELAHQLHIRILKGDEEKMGPKWFYEGFAIHAANQFQGTKKKLNNKAIWEIIHTDKDSIYQFYKEVIEYLLEKTKLEDLVKNAGNANFIESVHTLMGE